MSQFAVSPYKLQGFYQCAKWYYFEYLDQLISSHRRELRKPRPFLTVGDCVHKTLKKLTSSDKSDQTEKRALEILAQMWQPYAGERGGFPTLEEEKEAYADAEKMVLNFCQKQAKMDQPFYLPPADSFEELKKVEIGSDLVLQGKIDRVDRDGENLHVIDYKTGKSEDDEPFQIFAYALLVEEIFSHQVTRASYWYLRSNQIKSFLFDQDEKRKVIKRVEDFVADLEAERDFAPQMGLKCYVCDFVNFCPEREKVLEKISGKKVASGGVREIEELPF